jgi:nitrate reductase delta subunit
MADLNPERRTLHCFADILDYPGAGLAATVQECEARIASRNPGAAALLGEFRTFVESTPRGGLEAVYTSTFDLNATYHPYIGHHLLGETYKRSEFLLELKKRYRAHGFTAKETELPDHLAVVLHFMAACDDADLVTELIEDALLPTLELMVKQNDEEEPADGNKQQGSFRAYQRVLRALQMTLQQSVPNNEGPAIGETLSGTDRP